MATFRLEHVEDRSDGKFALSVWRAPELALSGGRVSLLSFLADDPELRVLELWADMPEGRVAYGPEREGAFFARAYRRGSGVSNPGGSFLLGESPVQARFNEDRFALVAPASAGGRISEICQRAAMEAESTTSPARAYGLETLAENGVLSGSREREEFFRGVTAAMALWRELGGVGNLGDFWAWADKPMLDALYPPGVLCQDTEA